MRWHHGSPHLAQQSDAQRRLMCRRWGRRSPRGVGCRHFEGRPLHPCATPGGEAFHDHHHDQPVSILHLPRKGFWNRIFDYNGTVLLVFEKLKMATNFEIAPQFATVKAKS